MWPTVCEVSYGGIATGRGGWNPLKPEAKSLTKQFPNIRGFPQNQGCPFGDPYNKGYIFLECISGSPVYGNYQIR